MDQHALYDACMRQAEFLAGRWDRRRTDEWKTTVSVWALLVGGIYVVKNPLAHGIWWKLLAVMLAVVIGYIWMWLRPVWKANDLEKTMGRFYRDQADAVMRGADRIADLNDELSKSRPSFCDDWSMRFQMLSLLVLLILFFIVPR